MFPCWKMLVVVEGCSIQSQSQASSGQSGTSHFQITPSIMIETYNFHHLVCYQWCDSVVPGW